MTMTSEQIMEFWYKKVISLQRENTKIIAQRNQVLDAYKTLEGKLVDLNHRYEDLLNRYNQISLDRDRFKQSNDALHDEINKLEAMLNDT